jgi:hypothetical protein
MKEIMHQISIRMTLHNGTVLSWVKEGINTEVEIEEEEGEVPENRVYPRFPS